MLGVSRMDTTRIWKSMCYPDLTQGKTQLTYSFKFPQGTVITAFTEQW